MLRRLLSKRALVTTLRILTGLLLALFIFNGCFSFDPKDMHPSPPYTGTVAPKDSFTLVSFNTWRLCDSDRVPAMVQALQAIGNELNVTVDAPILPDILLFQELECPDATDTLRALLEPTHWFDTNICALKLSGEPRSGVGIAISRARFEVVREQMIDLGQLFLDHGRCALSVTIRPLERQEEVQCLSIHHSPHPLKYTQTQQMFEQFQTSGLLAADRVIIGGDFNFTPRSRSYHLLTTILTDPFPTNRGKTHWIGGRIDLIFTNAGLTLLRPLDRKAAYNVIHPAGLFRSIYPCPEQDWTQCPLSDHLPEGGLFTFFY
jgi:endonuclease/exonuclease/phosphatase family metal-dependent hydrolase